MSADSGMHVGDVRDWVSDAIAERGIFPADGYPGRDAGVHHLAKERGAASNRLWVDECSARTRSAPEKPLPAGNALDLFSEFTFDHCSR